jgi:methionyl-tRNA synthetase
VDYYADIYLDLTRKLNLSNDNFIRTTDKGHIKATQEIWRLCAAKGDIYKKNYRGLYCVGCEKFITEKDLKNGKCEFHPSLTPQMVEEENYFFKLTNYKKKLLEYLAKSKSIIPEWRRIEAIDFAQNGMEDFSISRIKSKMPWGVAVPGDENHVMYVWFDAFVNYISTLGWPVDKNLFEKFWQNGYHIQTAGKDMVKFQSVMWQGMLMSAGLPTTDTIVYHGFVTGEGGIRMSKTLGNVINPVDIVQEYGADALRYFLLREISSFEDSPFTMERFKDAYNAGLANGLGNLVSRIMKLAETYLSEPIFSASAQPKPANITKNAIEKFNLQTAMEGIWIYIRNIDEAIQKREPFKVIKQDKKRGVEMIKEHVLELFYVAKMLEPFMPETAEKIQKLILTNKMPEKPLFLRKN